MRALLGDVLARYAGSGDRRGQYRALCAAAAAALPVSGASLTLMDGAGAGTLLAASDEGAERLAEAQFTTGDGPTAETYASGVPVLAAELDERRWPLLAQALDEPGVAAVFTVPLQMGAIRIGVLCLHRDRPGPLDSDQLAAVDLLRQTVIAAVLTDLDRVSSPQQFLAEVDGHEVGVHQATGMISVQLGSTAQEALLRLRAHAFTSGRPLPDVAADVIARRLSFRGRPADEGQETS
jgi:hypothetical protein